MKKIILCMFAVLGLLLSANVIHAQQVKIGVFSLEYMVRTLPDYQKVDSLMEIYEKDSLAVEYQFLQSEYNRMDSTYKLDSAAKKPASVLSLQKQQMQGILYQLVYWQQIAQNKYAQKQAILSRPLVLKVADAYKKVLEQKKYNLVLKPEAIEMGTTSIENVFDLVAKELKVPLSQQLTNEALGLGPIQMPAN